MTRSNSLDTDSQGQDRGDSTPGPEGKPHGTHTPRPRSAHDPAEGKPLWLYRMPLSVRVLDADASTQKNAPF